MDRPDGRRVLKFDGPSGRGLWIALRAMLIKSALRDLLSVSYGIVSILVISRYAAPPYPAAPDFPPSGRQNKTPRNILFINGSTVSTGYSATVHILHRMCKLVKVSPKPAHKRAFLLIDQPNCGGGKGTGFIGGAPRPANPVTCFPPGKVVAPATKGGLHFLARQGGC